MPRSNILILDEVKKYSANQENSSEDESLIEKIHAKRKQVIKFLPYAQACQTHKYNESHRNVKRKVGQKSWFRVKDI